MAAGRPARSLLPEKESVNQGEGQCIQPCYVWIKTGRRTSNLDIISLRCTDNTGILIFFFYWDKEFSFTNPFYFLRKFFCIFPMIWHTVCQNRSCSDLLHQSQVFLMSNNFFLPAHTKGSHCCLHGPVFSQVTSFPQLIGSGIDSCPVN